jgi:hypothetical protein
MSLLLIGIIWWVVGSAAFIASFVRDGDGMTALDLVFSVTIGAFMFPFCLMAETMRWLVEDVLEPRLKNIVIIKARK